MRPSLKALRSRASSGAVRAAAGAGPAAGAEPPQGEELARPGAVERGTMRRRLRRARRMRELLLTELGALVMEMHRQRRHDPALVERKAREALTADREAAGLARALGAEQTVREVVAAGIAGGCYTCGALLAVEDRFCARCGTVTPAAANGPARAAGAVAAPAPAPSTRAPAAHPTAPAPAGGLAAPPDPAARVAPPPVPAAPPPAPSHAEPGAAPPPPPDPSTRVSPPARDATVEMATGTTRQ